MNTKPLLAASLVVNALLLGAEIYLVKQDPGDLRTVPPLVVCVTHGGSEVVREPVASTLSAPNPAQRLVWQRVESEAYAEYVARLRGLGWPEKTIRDIITADVNQMFRTRAKAQVYSANRFGP